MIALKLAVWVWATVNVVASSATGQNYAERGYNPATVEYEEEDVGEEIDWNYDPPEVWRWNVEYFPEPRSEPILCRRTEVSNLCNPNEVLTVKEARSLDAIIRNIFNETSCICEKCDPSKEGVQIGVAVLKHAFWPYNEMPSKIVQSFARNLRSKWHLGDCDDDILIVLVTDDRMSYTDVGKATSKYITEERAYEIFLENKAYFTQGRYYEGLRLMLEAYREEARRIPRKVEEPEFKMGRVLGIIFGTLFTIAILAIVAIWFYRKHKKYKNSKGYHTSSADTLSSTWKRKLHISPPSFAAKDTAYQPCKTKDVPQAATDVTTLTEIDIVEDNADESTALNIDSPNHENHSQQALPIDQPDISSTGKSDVNGEENKTPVLKSFLPKKPSGLHQTDL